MKKKTIKLTDSSLIGIINEAIDEFRSDDFGLHGHDGDFYYTRPNGKTNIGTKLRWSDSSNTKRSKHNHRLPSGELPSVSGVEQVVYGHGKGSLCNNVIEFMQKEFQVDLFGKPTGKIEWTEKEQEAISNITTALIKLAELTKEEGNKKRGYNGPEKPEDLNEAFGHTTDEEKLEAMRQWKEENLADDLDWEVYERIDYYDTCLAGTVTSDEGWEFTAYGSGDEHGDFVGFDDNAPEIEFKMPDGREGYFYPKDIKVTMSESQLRNHIYEKVKKRLNEYDDPEHLGGGRVFKKLSELTFDEIMSILGEKDHFNMHYDESDAMRHIGNEASFEQAKKQLMDKFGDVMMSINPEAEWFDKVKIEDEDWKRAEAEYDREKDEFLAGCKYTD